MKVTDTTFKSLQKWNQHFVVKCGKTAVQKLFAFELFGRFDNEKEVSKQYSTSNGRRRGELPEKNDF